MVKVYIEGGGDCNSLKSELRRAFQHFFESAGVQKKPRVVASGSRHSAFKDFCCAMKTMNTNDVAILLVDSEVPVNSPTALDHLRQYDKWQFPPNTTNDQIHLMTQCMETWLIADQDALTNYFGPHFAAKALPQYKLEVTDKQTIYRSLDVALKNTPAESYNKGQHEFKVMFKINAKKVMKSCPSSARLVQTLKGLEDFMG